jgi:hypothetical protein
MAVRGTLKAMRTLAAEQLLSAAPRDDQPIGGEGSRRA